MQTLTYIIGSNRRSLVSDVQNFKINWSDEPNYNWVQARQYEKSMRQVFVNVKNEDGSPFDLTGANVWFEGLLPDGTHRVLDAKNGTILEPTNGQFRFDFPAQAFTVAGSYKQAFFRIVRDGMSVTTLEFDLEVLADKVITGLVPTDYITPFEDLYSDLEEILKKADSDIHAKLDEWTREYTAKVQELTELGASVTNNLASVQNRLAELERKIQNDDLFTNADAVEYKLKINDEINGLKLSLLNTDKNLQTKATEISDKFDENLQAKAGEISDEFNDKIDKLNKEVTNSMDEAKTLVEKKISQMDNGVHGYPNANAIKQAYPNGSQGIFVAVDTGHQWYYVNGQWTDGGVYQSEGNAEVENARVWDDGTVSSDLKSSITGQVGRVSKLQDALHSLVEIDTGELIQGSYVNNINGAFVSYAGWKRTGYIDVSAFKDIIFSMSTKPGDETSGFFNAFYDDKKNFLGYFGENKARDNSNKIITLPGNTKYVVFSMDSSTTLTLKGVGSTDEAKKIKQLFSGNFDLSFFGPFEIGGLNGDDGHLLENYSDVTWRIRSIGMLEIPVEMSLDIEAGYVASFRSGKSTYMELRGKNQVVAPGTYRVMIFKFGQTSGSVQLDELLSKVKVSSGLEPRVKKIISSVEKVIGLNEIDLGAFVQDSYIDNANGAFTSYEKWKRTDYIDISGFTKLLFTFSKINDVPGGRYNAFYTSDHTFISSFGNFRGDDNREIVVDIPENAKYVAFSMFQTVELSVFAWSGQVTQKTLVGEEKDQFVRNLVETSVPNAHKNSTNTPFNFLHISDIHQRPELWARAMKYTKRYSDVLEAVIHSGDTANAYYDQYTDLYNVANAGNLPIYNILGNHDVYLKEGGKTTKANAYNRFLAHRDNWNVTFMPGENSTAYFKDYADRKLRLIFLDNYYDVEAQTTWLEARLDEAKAAGYVVMTITHQVTGAPETKFETAFQTSIPLDTMGTGSVIDTAFDKVIGDWKKSGGKHVINICGHEHQDWFYKSKEGVVNFATECATDNNEWVEGRRTPETTGWDCFNVESVDTARGLFKIIRIGHNSDSINRPKNLLTYDYVNEKIISTC